jgi:hypothetical protein
MFGIVMNILRRDFECFFVRGFDAGGDHAAIAGVDLDFI